MVVVVEEIGTTTGIKKVVLVEKAKKGFCLHYGTNNGDVVVVFEVVVVIIVVVLSLIALSFC